MKAHTNDYKTQINTFGCEIDTKITYDLNGTTIELGAEELNSVVPHYEGAILKSVMKQLDLDSNVDIPLNTILNAQFGVKVNGSYEYINLGNFVVYSTEKQEDTSSYKITCYDKMLYSMKDYTDMSITYPITIRNYINTICTTLGLTFANSSDTFANYNRQIPEELYLDSDGNSLNYTFRDVLDELAEVTASTICINDNDELEIRYITDTNDTIDEDFLKDVNVNFGEKFGPINTIVLSRSADTDNEYYPDPLPANPYEIKISDNQIMNGTDRADYLPDIYTKLNGLEYYVNDFSSPGITYYELCDRYTVSIGGHNYTCVMLNDEINITQGLEENIYTELPEETVTDYNTASKDEREDNRAAIIINKKIGDVDIRGKNINLTSDNITISSTNFSVDTAGNVVANSLSSNNATITGGSLKLVSTDNSPSVIINGIYNSTVISEGTIYNYKGLNGIGDDLSYIGIGSSSDLGAIGVILLGNETNNTEYSWLDAEQIYITDSTNFSRLTPQLIDTPKITAGNIDCGTCTLNSNTNVSVSFNKTFANVPRVVLTPNTTTSGVIAPKIREVSTTGFKAIIGGSVSGSIDCDWIAIDM